MHSVHRTPKRSHAEAVKWIGRYLLDTLDKGLIIHPKSLWHFDCWLDADYAGNWHCTDANINPMMSKSRSSWVIRFAGAPITWASKMQTITALSPTEAEYIALSTSLREVIPLMGILKETHELRTWATSPVPSPESPLHCFRRQKWCSRTCLSAQNAPAHQTHQPVFPPFP